MRWTVTVLAVGMCMSGGVEAQDNGNAVTETPSVVGGASAPIVMTRMRGPIQMDGVLDEAAWQLLPLLPLVQHWPAYGAPMRARSEIRIGYDDEYLYAAGWFWANVSEARFS